MKPCLLRFLFSALAFTLFPGTALHAAHWSVQQGSRSLRAEFHPDPGTSSVTFEIHSSRNQPVVAYSDLSPLRPTNAPPPLDHSNECFYPVMDLLPPPGFRAVALFTDSTPEGQIAVNSWIEHASMPMAPRIEIPAERLLQWENTIWINNRISHLSSFHLEWTAQANNQPIAFELHPLSPIWSGMMVARPVSALGDALPPVVTALSLPDIDLPPPQPASDRRRKLRHALVALLRHTMTSINHDPRDPTRGGLYVFYDKSASTYRSPHWIWGWPPSVKLLLDAHHHPEIASQFEPNELLEAALSIGEASLRFVYERPGHPADGLPVSRWDRGPAYALGHDQAITPPDAGFIAGVAWIPLYEGTGDKKWLQAALRVADSIEDLMLTHEIPPQNFWTRTQEWSDRTIDESGFGSEVYAELYRVTGDPRYRELGRLYMEQHLAALGKPDGLWYRFIQHSTGFRKETMKMTRGLGWPMEGLLAGHRMLPNGRYLAEAVRMAEHLLEAQLPDGSWPHRFDRAVDEFGIGAKGTVLWSWLFYELHRQTEDPRHLHAARSALDWALLHQDWSDDPHARGGIASASHHAAVGYREFFPHTCTYAAGFFGLAILNELDQLDQDEGTIIYQESFDGPDTNWAELPAGWWFEGDASGAQARVEAGRLRLKADQKDGQAGTLWLEQPLPDNFEVEYDVRVSGAIDQSNNINTFLLFRDPTGTPLVQSRDNRSDGAFKHYTRGRLEGVVVTFLANGEPSPARLRLRRVPPFDPPIQEIHAHHARQGYTYHIRIRVQGNHIQYFVDHTKRLEGTIDPFTISHLKAHLGLRTWQTDISWDNIRIRSFHTENQSPATNQ